MACAPCPSTRLSAASLTAPPSPPIYAASGPSSTSHERSEVGCRWGLDAACGMHASRFWSEKYFLLKGKKSAQRGMSRTGLRLATATPALAALRPAHEHTRAQHARHARCTRASLASDARALTLQPALARQKARCVLDVTGHWLIVGRPAADTSGMHTHCIALAIAAARDPHALPTRCACHPPPTLSPYAEA